VNNELIMQIRMNETIELQANFKGFKDITLFLMFQTGRNASKD